MPELISGRLVPVTHELLGAAAGLAAEVGGQVCAVLIGHRVEHLVAELAERGADIVYLADDARLAEYDSETYSWVLAQAIRSHQPWAVLVPATSQGRDYAPRVGGELGLGLTGDTIGLEIDSEGRLCQLKPAFGGTIVATILTRTLPQLATVRAGMLKARLPRRESTPRVIPMPLAGLPSPRVQSSSASVRPTMESGWTRRKSSVCRRRARRP